MFRQPRQSIVRIRPALVALLVLIGCLHPRASSEAQPPAPAKFTPFNYYRAGNGFACVTPTPSADKPWVCDRIGALVIRTSLDDATRLLGPATRIIPRSTGETDYIFIIGPDDYIAVTAVRGEIVALQVTGPSPLPNWTFSGVGLGMSAGALRARLGDPHDLSAIAPEGDGLWKDGAVLWTYSPWTFSFEVARDRVISIHVGLK